MHRALGPLTAFVTLVAAASGQAMTIDVFPGGGTPLQDAINGAQDGDTLLVHAGTYSESVTIPKDRLRLVGETGALPIIDAGCGAATTVEIAADGVRIGGVQVQGATLYEIDIENLDAVTIMDTQMVETCASAQYGVNVFNSTRVKVFGSGGTGFSDAAIYIGGIPDNGRAKVKSNVVGGGNNRGILVEDSTGSVTVLRNTVQDGNQTGIFLHNSDGITIRRNTVGAEVVSGIELDPGSDNNRLGRNTMQGSPADAQDNGNGNVWACSNVFTTGNVPACP